MTVGEKIYGFMVKAKTYMEELQGEVYELYHEKSGARVLVVANDDENKTFCVGFKTIPDDSTGVFHILEHSVLNGSVKYPVQEPFVELMKCSMKNYLNALTNQDKTLYPFATVNEKDYLNLMDVYLDAVFHPLIYRRKEVFEQEGWHYEFNENEKTPQINGVVYNEMKGVFSSVDSRLFYAANKAMFPENTYGYVSGGDPAVIPSLTYEKFLAMHKRFYSSANCYMVLYGKMNVEEKLAFIDKEYLSHMQKKEYDYSIPLHTAPEKSVHKFYYPVEQPTGKDVQAALTYYVGTIDEREKIMAVDVLANALLGSNEAPLKKALLAANLGEDVYISMMDEILQPYLLVILRGTTEENQAKFSPLLRKEVERIYHEGIDKERLIAELNSLEFMLNEKGDSTPDGILCSMDVLAGWTHTGDPLLMCSYNKIFKELRAKLSTNYYEELLKELFLDNDYQAEIALLPESKEHDEQEKVKIEDKLQLLDPLTIGDLQTEELHFATEKNTLDKVQTLFHPIHTNGISYVSWYFDLGSIQPDDISSLQLMSSLLGNLDTTQHTAGELNVKLSAQLGSWNAYLDCFADANDSTKVKAKFVMSTSVLTANLPYAVTLPEELLLQTLFRQKEEIVQKIRQLKLNMERSFVSSGNYYAGVRMAAYHTLAGRYQERMQGYSYYKFLCDLLQDFDNRFALLTDKFTELQQIFSTQPLTVRFAGKKEDFAAYEALFTKSDIFAKSERLTDEVLYQDNFLSAAREAFIIPSQVSYNVLGYTGEYSGRARVLARVLNLDYLWKKVRAEGGAYGGGMQLSTGGNVTLYSYRDPNVSETYQVYKQIPAYLSSYTTSEEEMTQYIIGTIAQFDTVMKPRARASTLDRRYFTGETDEMRRKIREEICAVTAEDIRAMQQQMEIGNAQNCYCTFGNRKAIEKAAEMFTEIYTIQ